MLFCLSVIRHPLPGCFLNKCGFAPLQRMQREWVFSCSSAALALYFASSLVTVTSDVAAPRQRCLARLAAPRQWTTLLFHSEPGAGPAARAQCLAGTFVLCYFKLVSAPVLSLTTACAPWGERHSWERPPASGHTSTHLRRLAPVRSSSTL